MSAIVTAPPILVDATRYSAPFGTLTNPFGIFKVGSNLYQVLEYQVPASGNLPIGVYKSTDNGNTWVEQDAANHPAPTGSNNFGKVTTFNAATGVISILIVDVSGSFVYKVATFNTGTDLYGATSANSASFASGNYPAIYQKSSGDLVTPSNAGNALKYLTLIAGTWAGPTALGSNPNVTVYGAVVDSSDRGHVTWLDASGNFIYALLDAAFSLGSPTTLSSSADFDGTTTDQRIWSNKIAVSWTEGTVLKVGIGTPLSGAAFTTYTVGTVAGTGSLSYSFLAEDKDGNLVVFAIWDDNTTSPKTKKILMWTFDGVSSWGSPVEFYDAQANPPSNPPADAAQFFLNSAAIQLASGTWVVSTTIGTNPGGGVSDAAFVLTTGSGVPVITPPTATGQKNVAYSSAFSAAGGTAPYSWAITAGALPTGLSLDPVTGAITGIPTVSGVFTFTGHVVDSGAQTASLPCTITITQPVATAPTDTAIIATAYASSIGASGGTGPYTFAIITGALPLGLTLDVATGDITGDPTFVGFYPFTAQITDSLGNTGTLACSITVLNPAPIPELFTGPVQLPAINYWRGFALSANYSAQVFGPFTPSTGANIRVVITVVQTASDAAPLQHLSAMISLDSGLTWTETVGPSVAMSPRSLLTANPPINCYRLNDDIYTINASAAAVLGLYSFSLTSLAWSTKNASIATPATWQSAFILGINAMGIGVAFLYLDNAVDVILPPFGQSQSAPHFMVFNINGTNLFEATVLEPDTPYNPTPAVDTDWTQMWPFYSGRSNAGGGGIFGVDSAGNIWASGTQYSYDGSLSRQRTMMWPTAPVSATPTLSVSTPTSIDPSLANTINSIAIDLSTNQEAFSNALRTTDGATRILENPSITGTNVGWSAKALVLAPDAALWLGRLAYIVVASSSNAGNTRTLLVGGIQSPGSRVLSAVLATGDNPSTNYSALLGTILSAEINGNDIDVISTNPLAGVVGYSEVVELYYWRIHLPLPPTPPTPPITTPGIARGMSILTAKQFSELREKALVGMPTDIYLDHEFPNAGFHLWPIPSAAHQIEFYYWAVLQQFASLDDALAMPEGFQDALIFNLAIALCQSYRRPVPGSVLALAKNAKKVVQEINAQILAASMHSSRLLSGPNEGEIKPAALGPPEPRLLPGATEKG